MGLFKKPGKKAWYFRCRIHGRLWTRSTGTANRAEAEKRISDLRRLAELHKQPPDASPPLAQAIVHEVNRIELDVSAGEARRAAAALENFHRFLGNCRIDQISPPDLQAYARQRLQSVARNTVNRELCYVTRLLRQHGHLLPKPQLKHGRRTPHRPFTDDELRRFFEHCSPEQQLLFMVLLATGARPAELIPSGRSNHVALLKEELDPERNLITIRTAKLKPGQEGRVRLIRIPDQLMVRLLEHTRATEGPFVFAGRNSSLKNTFDRILRRAGIPKVDPLGRKLTAHAFRHTYATRMAEAVGDNPYLLQAVLGHAQITTTQLYIKPRVPDIVIDPLPFALPPEPADLPAEPAPHHTEVPNEPKLIIP